MTDSRPWALDLTLLGFRLDVVTWPAYSLQVVRVIGASLAPALGCTLCLRDNMVDRVSDDAKPAGLRADLANTAVSSHHHFTNSIPCGAVSARLAALFAPYHNLLANQ